MLRVNPWKLVSIIVKRDWVGNDSGTKQLVFSKLWKCLTSASLGGIVYPKIFR